MAWEVERKARVDDPEATRAALNAAYSFGDSYTKDDRYYRSPASPHREFRVRTSSRESGVVTHKYRRIVDRTEINDEQEFFVEDIDGFERFIGYIGCSRFAVKRKHIESWRGTGVLIELARVERLGWFLEVEAVVDSESEIGAARKRVEAIFDEVGVPEEAVEERTYLSMLAAAGLST